MSHFTRAPLQRLRTVRRQVFGFGQSRAAAERVAYRRGGAVANLTAEPVAMPEGVTDAVGFRAQGWKVDAVSFRAQGWIVSVEAMDKAGFGRPEEGDSLSVAGETWTVLKADGNHFARRSCGKDYLIYTKLSGAAP